VKDLDRSLFLEDDIVAVFDEMMKTLPKDHLRLNMVCLFYDSAIIFVYY